jgi:hypothetical protein
MINIKWCYYYCFNHVSFRDDNQRPMSTDDEYDSFSYGFARSLGPDWASGIPKVSRWAAFTRKEVFFLGLPVKARCVDRHGRVF